MLNAALKQRLRSIQITLICGNMHLVYKLYEKGILAIPVDPKLKKPLIPEWQSWYTQGVSREVYDHVWQGKEHGGVAVLCGTVECLDIDTKNDPEGTIADRFSTMVAEYLGDIFSEFYIQKTQSGGMHFWYRVQDEEVLGNKELATLYYTDAERFVLGLEDQVKKGTILETRGRGGYALVAPTVNYEVIQGTLLDLPLLTTEQRETLWMVARMFHREELFLPQKFKRGAVGDRPGDKYNAALGPRGLLELVELHGFRRIKEFGDAIWLGRPGAKHPNKHDAKISISRNCFVNYSSSVGGFEPMKGYSPFYVFANLACNGDIKEATRRIAAMGYGSPIAVPIPVEQAHPPEWVDENALAAELQQIETLRLLLNNRPNISYNLWVDVDGKRYGVSFPGALVAVYGKSKSRKTTVLTTYIASALAGRSVTNATYNTDGIVLWIDTEQGDLFAWETMRKTLIQSGYPVDTDRFRYYCMRSLSAKERIAALDRLVEQYKPTVLVLDGILDFSSKGMNDDIEAAHVIGKAMKWTKMGCTVFAVLHLNKTDNSERGHMGTILTNKCDVAIEVKTDEEQNDMVWVRNRASRGAPFPEYKLVADEHNILHCEYRREKYNYEIGLKAEEVQKNTENSIFEEDLPF